MLDQMHLSQLDLESHRLSKVLKEEIPPTEREIVVQTYNVKQLIYRAELACGVFPLPQDRFKLMSYSLIVSVASRLEGYQRLLSYDRLRAVAERNMTG